MKAKECPPWDVSKRKKRSAVYEMLRGHVLAFCCSRKDTEGLSSRYQVWSARKGSEIVSTPTLFVLSLCILSGFLPLCVRDFARGEAALVAVG